MNWAELLVERLILWILGPFLRPGRPLPPSITFASIQPRTEPSMAGSLTYNIASSSFADTSIVKATITPIINGTPGTPVDTAGPPVPVLVNPNDSISATETVTNSAGFVSDPSDPAAIVTAADPKPAKPAPPTISIAPPVA